MSNSNKYQSRQGSAGVIEFQVPADEQDEENDEETLELPAKFVVCSQCEGHGTHLNPAIGEHAYSLEEFEEAFDDDESREHYFRRGGIYDVTCLQCQGLRVVKVPDRERCAQDAQLTARLKRYDAQLEEDAAYERMAAAERRMGA